MAEAVPVEQPEGSTSVQYVSVAAPDGQVMGYVWFGDDGVGWADRKASSIDAYKAGLEWYGAHVHEARERGLAPSDILGRLGRETGVGPVTAAPDVAAVEELAGTVTPADDRRLIAALERVDAAAWRTLADAFDALTDEDRKVEWGGGQANARGVTQIPYPRYGEALLRAVSALRNVVVTTEYRWSANPLPELSSDGRLSPADAVRAAMALVLGERISEGMIDEALKNGLLDAAVASLRAWYATEGARSAHESAAPGASAAHTAPQYATHPLPHHTGNTITAPPPPRPTPPSANPYAQQPAPHRPGQPQYGYPQQTQPQYGMPPAPQGMAPQPYGYPQQGQAPYGQPQYGMGPQAGYEACRFCGGMPTARVTFRAHQGFLILMRFLKYDGPMCGTCGMAVYRTMLTATLWQGWWSPFSLFIFTPFTVIWNLVARGKVSKLQRPAPGQHGQQKDPGKPMYQRPLAYVALIPVLWTGFLIFQGIGGA
ncbi:DUF6508 domain-containing protein [Streptomyces sp. NPDC047117]|uniref:DUF6508 domain-containing protein n=1 Tax=Streptomyces sp. NPDC047117 TaxID=3155379 RepID=UPI0033C6509B